MIFRWRSSGRLRVVLCRSRRLPNLLHPKLTRILADSGARMVLHDGHTVLPTAGSAMLLGPEALVELKQAEPGDFAETHADDPAFLVYTSGTSGTPKGVLHAQRAASARRPMYSGWYGIGASDRLLHAGAFNWTYTLGAGLMDPWANGATSVVYDGPRDPDLWPDLMTDTRATLFAAVPSLYRRILKYGAVTPASFPDLRHGLTAGEALPASLYREWRERTGRELYEALGMSEISTYLSSSPSVPVKPGSPGQPQEGRKVSILSELDDTPVPVSGTETGLLAVHRDEPGLMLGYWNRAEETAAAFRGDWFLTGDRARTDEDGYFWYEGRADDLMNAFGYRVAPEEVERVLAAGPAGAGSGRDGGACARRCQPDNGLRGAGPPRTAGCRPSCRSCGRKPGGIQASQGLQGAGTVATHTVRQGPAQCLAGGALTFVNT